MCVTAIGCQSVDGYTSVDIPSPASFVGLSLYMSIVFPCPLFIHPSIHRPFTYTGNGHWIGSLVTIEALQKRGYTVRIFAGRDMPAPPANEDPASLLAILKGRTPDHPPVLPSKDIAYTSIQRLGNDLGIVVLVQRFLARLIRNPRLPRPLMIISDADLMGVGQAWLHNIPSLYITHGQVFVDSDPPAWLTTKEQERAWKRESFKNGFNSMLADDAIGFNHVPIDGLVRVSVRQEIQAMARKRHWRLEQLLETDKKKKNGKKDTDTALLASTKKDTNESEQPVGKTKGQSGKEPQPSGRQNPIVATYFRDANGGVVIREFVRAGYDVIVFGGGSKSDDYGNGPGRVIAVEDAAYFVPFMGIADGVVASAGCQLVAECVHAQIPMLALYKEADPEHELNVLMAQRLSYPDGQRLLFGTTFESLGDKSSSNPSAVPVEVELFMKQVQASKASTSFYLETARIESESKATTKMEVPKDWKYTNELEEGTPEHLDLVMKVLDKVEAKNKQCSP